MKVVRILNVEPDNYSAQARDKLLQLGELHEEACDRTRLMQLIPDFDVLIVRLGHRVDAELLACAKRLKVVVTATTGLNHIDVGVAGKLGIEVLCLKGERSFLDTLTATAELTWAILLGLLRRLPDAHYHVINGGWDRDAYRGRQLKDKILGVIGFGRLGSMVADYGHAFRMRVLVHDPYVVEMPDWVEKVDMDTLLGESDVVSLHIHLNSETCGYLGVAEFARMKPGAVLLNTSRGELIDETAMLAALESGQLAGAGLDTLYGEAEKNSDWPCNNKVWNYARHHNNIVLTPHIGGATFESMAATEMFMAQKLEHFLSGGDV